MTDPYPLSSVLPASKPPRPRWVIPVIAGLAVLLVAVGAVAAWALADPGGQPAAATTPSPTPTAPRMSEAVACIRAMDHTNVAIELITVFANETSVDVDKLNRTVDGLREVQASLPAGTQAHVADVIEPLRRIQLAVRDRNTGTLSLDFTDFKTGAMEITIYCGVYLLGDPTAPAAGTIDEGVWTVGDDIRPGRYRTTEVVNSDCYWSITKSGTNGDDIIANDIPGGGRPTVTLRKGQDFTTHRCGTWTRLK